MDPHYVHIHWGPVAAEPIANWNIPASLVGNVAAIPNLPTVFEVPSAHDASMLTGSLATQFQGTFVVPIQSLSALRLETR